MRKRVVHLHDAVFAVRHDDQIEERVERVFEQPALPEHLLEQLDVFDPRRQLAAEVCREVERVARSSSSFEIAPSTTSVPSARRQPRSGAMSVGPGVS